MICDGDDILSSLISVLVLQITSQLVHWGNSLFVKALPRIKEGGFTDLLILQRDSMGLQFRCEHPQQHPGEGRQSGEHCDDVDGRAGHGEVI